MLKQRGRGFTMVEILVVVVLVILILTIGIPHFIRARTTANEGVVVGNLRTLANGLAMYRSTTNSYPTDWLADMYTAADPHFGPDAFMADLQAAPLAMRGYRYRYQAPAGPPPPITFTIVASPVTLGLTGTRTFWVDESGEIYHCTGDDPATAVPENVETVKETPAPCPS